MDNIYLSKKKLRADMFLKFSRLNEMAKLSKEKKLNAHILGFIARQRCDRIGVYLAKSDEANIDLAIRKLLENNYLVYAPVIADNIMIYRQLKSLDNLPINKFGIREPGKNAAVAGSDQLDLILVPAVAFDLNGNRVGRGSGYFDKYLAFYHKITVGVCFGFQVVDKIKTGNFDMPVGLFITENGSLSCQGQK